MGDSVVDFFEGIDLGDEELEKLLIFGIYYGGDLLDVLGFSDIFDNEDEEKIKDEVFKQQFEDSNDNDSINFFVEEEINEKEDRLKEEKESGSFLYD